MEDATFAQGGGKDTSKKDAGNSQSKINDFRRKDRPWQLTGLRLKKKWRAKWQ